MTGSKRQGNTQRDRETRRRPDTSSKEDLAKREYRDEHGEVHHHTKKYMEQHEGDTAERPESEEQQERDEEE